MYPKGSKESSIRRSRLRKKKFQGNQFTNKEGEDVGESASKRKLETASSEDIPIVQSHAYRIIQFVSVFSAISELLICRVCKLGVTFSEASHRGLSFKIIVQCRCGRKEINSGPFINNGYEINRRIVFAMRLLGVGCDGIHLFCNLMDLGAGISKAAYNGSVQHIHSASKAVFEILCKKAVKEEQEKNIEHERAANDLKVSGDGTWKKRGFTSRYGVTTLIGYYTGKIVDLVVKASFCQACNYWKSKKTVAAFEQWYEEHEEECAANHEGSAGKMEVDAVKEMFSRSEEKFQVKYGNYIGDGDSKTFKAIVDLNPYGDEFQVIKSVCIGHVQKKWVLGFETPKKIIN